MSDCNVVIDQNIENINVIIDDKNPNLGAYYTLLSNINSNYNNISNATNNVMMLSAKWVETAIEMDTLQESATAKWVETAIEMDTLQEAATAKWIETAIEMDTLQIGFSGSWQDTTEYISKGVIDMGYF